MLDGPTNKDLLPPASMALLGDGDTPITASMAADVCGLTLARTARSAHRHAQYEAATRADCGGPFARLLTSHLGMLLGPGRVTGASAKSDTALAASSRSARKKMMMVDHAVLVVDDDRDLLWALSDTLELEGIQHFSASSAEEAIRLYKANHSISLIITDVWMPDHDGNWVIKSIGALAQQQERPVTFIKMSGQARSSSGSEAQDDPDVSGFLVKPFSSQELVQAIRRARDNHPVP